MKKNVTTLFLLFLTVILVVSGCGAGGQPSVSSKEGSREQAAASFEEGSREQGEALDSLALEEGCQILTDDMGIERTIKENPQHVSSLFAVCTHYFGMMGAIDKVVSITEGNTRDYLFCEMYPQVYDIPAAKGNNTVNMETLLSDPVPDVVVINPETMLDESTEQKLSSLGIPVFVSMFGTFEEQMDSAKKLAALMGDEHALDAYLEYYRETLQLVKERTSQIEEKDKKTVYHAINELLRTDKEGTVSKEIISTCGGINIADEILADEETTITGKSYIALEELMHANPEYIFINGGDVYDYLEANSQYHHLQAYENGHIYVLPLGVSRWGHPNSVETPLALLFIAKTLYPELFEDLDMEAETKTFYQKIFHYELSEEQLENIMGGRVYKEIKGGKG